MIINKGKGKEQILISEDRLREIIQEEIAKDHKLPHYPTYKGIPLNEAWDRIMAGEKF